jgi:hypothetical protein
MKKKHFIFIIQNNNKNRKHIKKVKSLKKKLKREPSLKKPRDFTVVEGHGHPLVKVNIWWLLANLFGYPFNWFTRHINISRAPYLHIPSKYTFEVGLYPREGDYLKVGIKVYIYEKSPSFEIFEFIKYDFLLTFYIYLTKSQQQHTTNKLKLWWHHHILSFFAILTLGP